MTDSQDRGAAQSLIICSDPTSAEIVGGPLDAALLCHGKSLCCRHCFASQIAAAEAERAKAQDEHVRQMTDMRPTSIRSGSTGLLQVGGEIRRRRYTRPTRPCPRRIRLGTSF